MRESTDLPDCKIEQYDDLYKMIHVTLLIGYRVSQTIDIICPHVAVNLPQDPQTGHSPMTHPPIYLDRLNADSPIHNRSLLLMSYPPSVSDFLLLEAIKPDFLKKI